MLMKKLSILNILLKILISFKMNQKSKKMIGSHIKITSKITMEYVPRLLDRPASMYIHLIKNEKDPTDTKLYTCAMLRL